MLKLRHLSKSYVAGKPVLTDINLGIVNILVGFAPLKPAEFVVLRIQQIAGDIAT